MIELIGKELFQWDKGRQLKINADVNKAVFSTDNVQGISRDIVDNIVTIPDSLLEEGKPILVYITIKDEEQRQVIRRKMFNVIPAPKPEDYEETEEAFTEKLENLLDLMYNGNIDEILVFTNEGPQWVNKNEIFEEGVMKETDPTVPEWAKQEKKPSYTANEVGAIGTGEALYFNDVLSLENNPQFKQFVGQIVFRNPSESWTGATATAYVWDGTRHLPLSSSPTPNIEPFAEGWWKDAVPSCAAVKEYVDEAISAYDTEAKTYLENALALLGEDGDGE